MIEPTPTVNGRRASREIIEDAHESRPLEVPELIKFLYASTLGIKNGNLAMGRLERQEQCPFQLQPRLYAPTRTACNNACRESAYASAAKDRVNLRSGTLRDAAPSILRCADVYDAGPPISVTVLLVLHEDIDELLAVQRDTFNRKGSLVF